MLAFQTADVAAARPSMAAAAAPDQGDPLRAGARVPADRLPREQHPAGAPRRTGPVPLRRRARRLLARDRARHRGRGAGRRHRGRRLDRVAGDLRPAHPRPRRERGADRPCAHGAAGGRARVRHRRAPTARRRSDPRGRRAIPARRRTGAPAPRRAGGHPQSAGAGGGRGDQRRGLGHDGAGGALRGAVAGPRADDGPGVPARGRHGPRRSDSGRPVEPGTYDLAAVEILAAFGVDRS